MNVNNAKLQDVGHPKLLVMMKSLIMVLIAFSMPIVSMAKEGQSVIATKRAVLQDYILGKVLDEKGQPIEGVNVKVKGKNASAQTNADGEFKIRAAVKDILIFTYIGYDTKALIIGTKNLGNIVLKTLPSDLNEVVVVGYGTVKKSDLTGSVGRFTAKNTEETPVVSIDQALQGRVSGVQITESSGSPGAGLSFLIRGGNSLGSNAPLVILDGYPIDLGDGNLSQGADGEVSAQPGINPLASLNPNDVESIEILKDASSTAIYGSRGANGVVIVTTKRGKLKQDDITFNYRTDAAALSKKIAVLNTRDFITYANEGRMNVGLDSLYDSVRIKSLIGIDNNWQDMVYHTGITNSYQFSMSGGEDKGRYYFGGDYLDMGGIIRNSGFERGGFRFNYDRKVSKALNVKLNVTASKSTSDLGVNSSRTGVTSANVVASALYFRTTIQPYDEYGEIDDEVYNPITMVELYKDKRRSNLLSANFTADLKLTNDLTFRTNVGAYNTSGSRFVYSPRGTYVGDKYSGYAYRAETSRFNYLAEFTLNYKKKIKRHEFDAVAGYTWQQWDQKGLGTSAGGFANDNLTYESLQSGNLQGTTNTSHTQWALASYLGRLNYTFNNKYLLTFTGRADGSSKLAQGNKWQFFPSAAIAWKVNEENFFKDIKAISTFKLRASYGLSGNQNIAVGGTQATLGTDNYVINGVIVKGSTQSNIANPVLGWETTKQLNIGADLAFLKDRIQLTVELYRKITNDMLVSLPVPASTGFSTYLSNAGSIENKGLEIELSANVLRKQLKWNVSGNISFNRNKMVDMGTLGDNGAIFGPSYLTASSLLSQPIHIAVLNSPVGSFYGYRINGIYQNAFEVAAGPESATAKPGDFKFVDLNHDGVISSDDREILGNPYPDFTFGLTNSFSYKRFTLSFLILGSVGNDIVNLNRYRLDALSTNSYNVSQKAFDNRWTGEGTSNYYPRATNIGTYFSTRFSDFIIEDGSYVRLKNVNIGYTFPVKKLKWIKSAKVFATGTNLLTITNYTGYDPEVNADYDSGLTQGVDNGTYPKSRTLSVGVNLKF